MRQLNASTEVRVRPGFFIVLCLNVEGWENHNTFQEVNFSLKKTKFWRRFVTVYPAHLDVCHSRRRRTYYDLNRKVGLSSERPVIASGGAIFTKWAMIIDRHVRIIYHELEIFTYWALIIDRHIRIISHELKIFTKWGLIINYHIRTVSHELEIFT